MEVIIVWCSQANPKKNKMIVQLTFIDYFLYDLSIKFNIYNLLKK